MDLKLAILRKKGKRTWTQFAKDVGVTRQSLLNYMSGRFQPRYNTLAKLGLVKNADRSPNPTSQASA
jgi:transcriptional regulator with XRE-family HTH domain